MGSIGAINRSVLQNKEGFYKSLDKVSRNIFGKQNANDFISQMVAEDDKKYADKVLTYFQENNIPLVKVNDETGYPEWQFTGNNKYGRNGKEWSSFEVDAPTKERAVDSLRKNGYTVNSILPKNIYDYAIDHTDMTPDQMRVLNAIGTAAIKEWKNRR